MKKFNPNWIGLALIIGCFGYSAIRFARISIALRQEEDPDGGKQVLRVLHWQLEPGYREGMDMAISAYNQLPHVKANGVEVRQLAVTERVYAQFINVHLISGTAPDIVARGQSSLIGAGASTARFFTPISEFVAEPNPYNAPEYLPGGNADFLDSFFTVPLPAPLTRAELLPETIDPELARFLGEASWNETFLDGMLGGWDDILQDYYLVPVSSWGAIRTFYNADLTAEIKAYLAMCWTQSPQPDWLKTIVETERMVTPDDAFLAWIATPDFPDTMGRFMVFNEAVLAYGRETPGMSRLVPISASNYHTGTMVDRYITPFTYRIGDRIDLNRDSSVSGMELLGTWQAGIWSFDEAALRDGFYDLVLWLARYYPAGYLGLDREQAVRRFLNRQAVTITTGGWDAPTLFTGAKSHFNIGVTDAPLPVNGERWAEYNAGRISEAEFRVGVPLAIYNRSQNRGWALDFLQFLSSYSANQIMNVRAGWVPSIVGTRPKQQMLPFLPNTEGLKGSVRLGLANLPTVGHVYDGQFPLFQSGAIDFETFVHHVSRGFLQTRTGIDRMWFNSFVDSRDRIRSLERSSLLLHLETLKRGQSDEGLWMKHINLLETNLRELDGFMPPAMFHSLFPERSFPQF